MSIKIIGPKIRTKGNWSDVIFFLFWTLMILLLIFGVLIESSPKHQENSQEGYSQELHE